MTNKQKIERFHQIYADFVASLSSLKNKAAEQEIKKSKAQEKAEIEDILNKIKSNF
jgi:hypothetical protein